MATAPDYVSRKNFDVEPETWATAMDEIRDVLIQKARQRAMIPYSELVDQVHTVRFTPHDVRLFSILGQLSTKEHEQGRPLLSVLVVHKNGDMQPGEGYFELAASLGRDTKDILKSWITEVQSVFQHWNS